MGRIVVGVDGSKASQRALEWAARQASLEGAELEVVHAYEYETPWMAYASYEGMTREQVEGLRAEMEGGKEAAHRHAQAMVDGQVADLPDDLRVQAVAVETRRPAEVLVERSSDADLLVVGSRGRGGFKGLMLGSVSQQCATHASCPVVIIRAS